MAMSWKTGDGIRVYTRRDWGARLPKEKYSDLGPLRTAVIHHGGPVGGPRWTFKAAAQTARSWQDYHMDVNGWADIGYHFLIDARGRIYLGRPPEALGAHVLKENTGRIGINFMQDGRFHGLTVLQMWTLRKLFRSDHDRLGLPALKRLANRPGDFGVLGHREVPRQSTECPGREILIDLHRTIKDFT
jgi:N-acetylmuramoyl-L-alanine amidase